MRGCTNYKDERKVDFDISHIHKIQTTVSALRIRYAQSSPGAGEENEDIVCSDPTIRPAVYSNASAGTATEKGDDNENFDKLSR